MRTNSSFLKISSNSNSSSLPRIFASSSSSSQLKTFFEFKFEFGKEIEFFRFVALVRSGGGMGRASPPSKEKKLVLGGCQNVLPSDKYRKKSNVFTGVRVVCGYGLRRYFPAYLVAIMTYFTNQTRTIFQCA